MLVVIHFLPGESEGPVKALHGFVLLCFQESEKFSSRFLYQDQELPPEAFGPTEQPFASQEYLLLLTVWHFFLSMIFVLEVLSVYLILPF